MFISNRFRGMATAEQGRERCHGFGGFPFFGFHDAL
jgi:hypothetical protein